MSCRATTQSINDDRYLNANQIAKETGIRAYALMREAALNRVRAIAPPYGNILFHLGDARTSARLLNKSGKAN